MPKMPVIRAKNFIKALASLGFVIDHIQGSHHILRRADGKKITIAVHGSQEIPIGTLHGILIDLGMSKEELINIL